MTIPQLMNLFGAVGLIADQMPPTIPKQARNGGYGYNIITTLHEIT